LNFPAPTKISQIEREAVEENTGEKFRFTETLEMLADFVPDVAPAACTADVRGLAEVGLVLFNTNEFLTLECPMNWHRREMLFGLGAGLGSIAFSALHAAEQPKPVGQPHHPPKATRVIFLLMEGGPSYTDVLPRWPLQTIVAVRRPNHPRVVSITEGFRTPRV
jgi:hypothetical protein